MKTSIIVIMVSCIFIATVCSRSQDKYTTKYDNIDIDQVLRSNRLLGNYVNCLLDKGKCNPDAAELKRRLPDALLTSCAKCSEKQRNISRKVIRHLIDNKPDIWKSLEAKYDPQGSYRKQYEAELRNGRSNH